MKIASSNWRFSWWVRCGMICLLISTQFNESLWEYSKVIVDRPSKTQSKTQSKPVNAESSINELNESAKRRPKTNSALARWTMPMIGRSPNDTQCITNTLYPRRAHPEVNLSTNLLFNTSAAVMAKNQPTSQDLHDVLHKQTAAPLAHRKPFTGLSSKLLAKERSAY